MMGTTSGMSPEQAAVGAIDRGIVLLPVESLYLDGENPRLASAERVVGQEDIVRLLWREMAVDEIAISIAENGFFQHEPLLVVPRSAAGEAPTQPTYTVIEGNRRLAAVMLLRNKELRAKVRADVPEIDDKRLQALNFLPAIVYEHRRLLWQYLGFRHVNGTKPWDAFSKAKYVADVYEQYGVPLRDIARKIGDTHATVIRLYRGYKLLQQAEEQAGFDQQDRIRNRFYFSHLYTAADQPEFQRFLGITPDSSLKPNPVPKSRLPELRDLMVWLYGRRSTNTHPLVQTQNPDLSRLRIAISTRASVSALRQGVSLERAFEIGIGDKRRFQDALTAAKDQLQQAKGTVTTGYTGEEDLLGVAADILLYAQTIKSEMDSIRERRGRGTS